MPRFLTLLMLMTVVARGALGNDTVPAAGTPSMEKPVAVIGTQPISSRDLQSRTTSTIEAQEKSYQTKAALLKLGYARDRQAYLERSLNALIDERVLALEAKAKKSTPEALTAALKSSPPTDADVHAFYDANKSAINQPFASAAPQLKGYLQAQADQQARRDYLDGLRVKYKVVSLLPPLRETVDADGPARGPADAPVTIVEFADFQCPFCARLEPALRDLLAKYPNQVRLVYRNMPLTGMHPDAQTAAEAAACAREQGKFWEMHDALFADPGSLKIDGLKAKAAGLGLDMSRFDTCLDSGSSKRYIESDVAAADNLGIAGTPSGFINGRFFTGAISTAELSKMVDEELNAVGLLARR